MDGYDVTIWNDHVRDIDALPVRLADIEARCLSASLPLLPSDVAREVAAQIRDSKRRRTQFIIALRPEYLESFKRHEYVDFQNLLQKRN